MRGEGGDARTKYRNLVPITHPSAMTNKKSFVLRIDGDIYKALEKWASDEFRSVNGQIEWLISLQLKEAGRIKKGKDDKNIRPDNQKK